MFDELDEELGVNPAAAPQVPAPEEQDGGAIGEPGSQAPLPAAVSQADAEAVDPRVLEARKARDQDLAFANIMQGITQIGTGLGSQGRVSADGGAFDAVRNAANRRVQETEKDVDTNRKLAAEALKAKALAASELTKAQVNETKAREAEDWRRKNFQQRDRMIEATRVNREKPTDVQNTSAGFARRMEQAEKDLSELEGKGFNRSSLKNSVLALDPTGFLEPEDLKRQKQAELNFLSAVLRKESGAAIGKDEIRKGELQYFPRGGDTPAVIEQKRRNRQQAQESIKASAGKAYDKIPLIKKDSKPKTVIQNGHTYTWNEKAGRYE